MTEGASIEEIEKSGLGPYYTDHGVDIYPQSAGGTPFTAAYEELTLRITKVKLRENNISLDYK